MRNERDIEKRIEAIEKQLSTLKLELEEIKREKRTGPIKKGDRVSILNPNRGQGRTGIIQKVNPHTERVTVEAYNLRGVKELIIRKITNVERIEK